MKSTSSELLTLLSELFALTRNYNKICDLFKIPPEKRGESYIADQIIERIQTYLTGYIARRSISERENGAAFREPDIEPLPEMGGEGEEKNST